MRRWLRRHRSWAAIMAFIALFGGAFLLYRTIFAAGSSKPLRYVTQPAEIGTLVVSVSGTGNAALGSEYAVSPEVSGTVTGITVKVGDKVTKGQTLFLIDNPQLDADVVSARGSYDQARASYINAQAGVAQARQSLSQLRDQQANPSSGTVNPSNPPSTGPPATPPTSTPPTTHPPTSAPPTTAPPTTPPPTTDPPTTDPPTTDPPTTVLPTTVLPTTVLPTTAPPHTLLPAAAPPAITTQKAAPRIALAALAQPSGQATGTATTAQVAQTSATVTDTDIEIAAQKVAAAKASLSAAEAGLRTAEFNLQNAENAAANRTVSAPAAGVVAAVNVVEGSTVGSGGASGSGSGGGSSGGGANSAAQTASTSSSGSTSAAVTIVDPEAISVVVPIGEVDIPSVKVGQKATLTFDALPDLTLAGKVTEVDLAGTVSQGVVTFDVTIVPDLPDSRVRAGMTAAASIVTNVRQNVLLVPSSAVKSSSSGGSYVQVLVNGAPQDRAVEIGLSDDTSTEITSGLQAGDEVVTQAIDPNATATTTRTGGTRQGGFGGGPGGGFIDIPGR